MPRKWIDFLQKNFSRLNAAKSIGVTFVFFPVCVTLSCAARFRLCPCTTDTDRKQISPKRLYLFHLYWFRKSCQKCSEINQFCREKFTFVPNAAKSINFLQKKFSKMPRNQSIFWRKTCKKCCKIDFLEKILSKIPRNQSKLLKPISQKCCESNPFLFLKKNVYQIPRNGSIFFREKFVTNYGKCSKIEQF